MVRIEIPAVPPSANELRRKYRHWAVYARLRRDWELWLFSAAPNEEKKILWNWCKEKRRVRIKIFVTRGPSLTSGRRTLLDADNLEAGIKPILDACRALGYIKNDHPRWLDKLPVEQKKGEINLTAIEFEDAGEVK